MKAAVPQQTLRISVLLLLVTGGLASMLLQTFATPSPALLRREECPANMFHCPDSLGDSFKDVCCEQGQTCAFDDNHSPACCPQGLECTGAAPANPQQTAAPSYVPNSFFSFPYEPTTFSDRKACTSAARACSKNYDNCITQLQDGNARGLTINVPDGGGRTVDGGDGRLATQATSICASLSSKACFETSKCESFSSSSASQRAGASNRLVAILVMMTFMLAI